MFKNKNHFLKSKSFKIKQDPQKFEIKTQKRKKKFQDLQETNNSFNSKRFFLFFITNCHEECS
jgi:hypothetical protein